MLALGSVVHTSRLGLGEFYCSLDLSAQTQSSEFFSWENWNLVEKTGFHREVHIISTASKQKTLTGLNEELLLRCVLWATAVPFFV